MEEANAVIDQQTIDQLRELMGSDFMVELIDTYCQETGMLIEQLYQTLASRDTAAFGRCAHSIKSSSASLGALIFSQQARELEMMGKANDLSEAESKLEKLAADFVLVKQSLEELRNEP